MSGHVTSEEQSSSPVDAFLDDLAAGRDAADEDETAPLTREASELETSVFPGVPFS